MSAHPEDALFQGEKPFPVIPTCEHFAGSEKLIQKALELQAGMPTFDVTMDCEDGAQAGREKEHAEMVVAMLRSEANARRMAGVRIHDYTSDHWTKDVDVIVGGAGDVVAYLTIPKSTTVEQVERMIKYVQGAALRARVARQIPVHVLIETHGA